MAEQLDTSEDGPAFPVLKVVEPDVNPEDPWQDDVLDRKEVADRLTRIVRGQGAPFVISVDGRWGTGKTFLLKRWAQDLQNQDPQWRAIYYNAWEDDFAQDPLLAIIAQLSEHLGEGFGERVTKLVKAAGPLLYYGASLAALVGAGIPLPPIPAGGDDAPSVELDAYEKKTAAKDELREVLERLASEVRKESGQPLVFIIDELDRCRPTFAIELLERVKHIFDVPNMVFVFGINRGELVKSLESVYGEIDAGTYLRRFFDMEFLLPAPDSARFCRHLLKSYRLDSFFSRVSRGRQDDFDFKQFRVMGETSAFILGTMGLSLRDMDYCVRLLSLATRDMQPGEPPYPELFSVLIALKIANQELYRRFVEGTARGADVINYMNTRRGSPEVGARYRSPVARAMVDRVEEALYCADSGGTVSNLIDALMNGWPLENRQYLAEHHLRLDPKRDQQQLIQLRGNVQGCARGEYPAALAALAQRIDIHDGFVRP